MTSYQEVIDFWFQELCPEQWFKKDKSTNLLVKERFLSTHSDAVKGKLYKWRHTALGRLAEVYRSCLKFPIFEFLLYLAGRWDLGH